MSNSREEPTQPEKPTLTITERLAADRTSLANERTLLAYSRLSLALIATGTGFGQFLNSVILRTLFLLFIPIGILILVIGMIRFRQRRKTLNHYRDGPSTDLR